MTAEPRLTIAFTGVDVFRAAWHHGQPGPTASTSATPDPSHGSATVVDGSGIGAVGPRDTDDVYGEVGVVTVGPSGESRPAAPHSTTTRKAVSS